MAERRMFTQKIVESDAFTEMPLSAQALYFHLGMVADDDGFVNNPKKVCRSIAASEDDLKILLLKRFLLSFESGIVVLKHWRMNNQIRKDRYTETLYKEEKNSLMLKENGAYSEAAGSLSTTWQPNGNQMATTWQPSIVEYSKEEYRVVESSGDGNRHQDTDVDKSVDNSKLEKMSGNLGKGVVFLSDAQRDALWEKIGFEAFEYYVEKLANFIIEKDARVSNHYETILKWAKEDAKV